MNKRAAELFGRVKAAWTRSSPAQRWLVAGLAVVLALAVGVGYYLNRPQWVVLVSQADPKDAAAIVARLDELKVPYQPTGDGYTIMVPKSEQYTAKLALAQAGLPNGGTVGMELFDQTSFGATEFDKRVSFLRAQQGELERALLRIAEVEYANVKLAIPDDSVFVREQDPVTAAVLVQTRAGKRLSSQQIEGIIQFVSSSVQGLAPENVKVVDQSGKLLSAGLGDSNGLATDDGDQLERQRTLQQEVEHRVQTLLEPIFGTGNVVSRVNLELNMDASRVESQTVGSAAPTHTAVTQESSTTPQGGAAVQAQGDTAAAPVYQGQAATTGTGGETWRSTSETDYAVSQRKEVTLIPPGAVKRISVGIAINQPSLTADQIAQIQQTVAGATGAATGDISVVAMAFDQGNTAVATAGNASGSFQPMPIAVGAALALAVLLFGLVMTRRRRHQAEMAMAAAMAEQAAGLTTGAALNVALGLDEGNDTAAAAEAGDEAHAAPVAPETQPTPAAPVADESKPNTPRKQLEIIMASKPKRQLIIDGQPIDEALLNSAEDLIQSSPEAAAEVIRQWIKGGP